MKKIEAKIVADSVSPQGHRITSFILTYPRFIHSELMTHRMFSRNSASSRAIPFEKMVKMVEEDPFIPIAWQKDHKGMQGNEYFTEKKAIDEKEMYWITASKSAINMAKKLNNHDVTKQLCNRLLEPFQWYTCLVTATEFENFFELRCPKYQIDNVPTVNLDGSDSDKKLSLIGRSKEELIRAISEIENPLYDDLNTILGNYTELEWLSINKSQAEIHIQTLAESMWDAMNESTPKQLQSGEWHLPFNDNIDEQFLSQTLTKLSSNWFNHQLSFTENIQIYIIKVSVARAARLSYMTFDGVIDYEKDLELHDKLLESKHLSPMEHCAVCKNDNIWYANFKGWQSYRYLIENDT